MRWDKDNLEGLHENLHLALNQSIYKNALPFNINRIDLTKASIQEDFAPQFIQKLLENTTSKTEIQIEDDISYKWNHLYLENKNNVLDQGTHTLSIGYPFFILKEEEHHLTPIVAPLFIWEIEIEPSTNRTNTWFIYFQKNQVKSNSFLIDYLKNKFNIDYEETIRALIINKKINKENILALCNNISTKFNQSTSSPKDLILPLPTAEEFSDYSEEPQIRFSAVLGLWNQSHFVLSHYIQEKIKKIEEQPIFSEPPSSSDYYFPFSIIKPDPSQKNVGIEVSENNVTVAEGAPGTGKTTTAIHVASNTLLNNGTCLIISPYVSNLNKISEAFTKNKLSRTTFFIKDAIKDLQAFYYSMKQMAQPKEFKNENHLSYKILLERCMRKHERLEAQHRMLNQKAFGSLDFTDTVGYYIKSSRHIGKDILSGRLFPYDYACTFKEHDTLKTDINKAEKLYQNTKKLEHPLGILHEEIFLGTEIEIIKKETEKKVHLFKHKTEQLIRRFTLSLESYRDNLRDYYEEHSRELNTSLQLLKDKIGEYAQVFGDDFKKSSHTKIQMYGVFSNVYYNIKEAQKEIITDFFKLEELFNEKRCFEYKFPKKKDVTNIIITQKYLTDFEESLTSWTNNIGYHVTQESNSLNSKSVSIHLDYKSRIGELEYTHDLLLEELNQVKLFKEWFSYDGMTLNKRLHSLEQLWESLERIKQNLNDFENFFPWQKHWLEISPLSRTTITGIIQSKTKNWLASFNSWYFYNCLSDKTFMAFKIDENLKEEYIKELHLIRNKFSEYIISNTRKEQESIRTHLKKKSKNLYQLIYDKKAELPADIRLKDIFKTYAKEITKWIPCLTMTADVAEELLTDSSIHFDLVIFDDAHNIPSVQAIPLMDKADRTLIIGDRQQAFSQQKQKSLMDSVIEAGSDIHSIYYKHSKNEMACSDFINYTSYQKGIKNINYFQRYYQFKGISLHYSESRYNEEKFINNLEAEHLVRILSEIPLNKKGEVPHTAIVTNTVEQRNHIHSYLLYIKQKRNPFCHKVIQLEEAGLRVLHVSELHQHYETIVWSMTYGVTNLRGHVTDHFYDMESLFGQSTLNVILGHVKNNLIVISSISQNYIDKKINEDINACGPIIKFLKYASIIQSNSDDIHRQEYLEKIEWPGLQKNQQDQHQFMTEVKNELEPYFEPHRIKIQSPLHEIGTAAITIITKDFRQPVLLVIGDSIDRNHSTKAFEFEESVLKQLEQAGYAVFKTNSLDWWKNPKKEARVLASKLIKADNMLSKEYKAVK